VRLIERRIGLLFAVFLGMLALAGVRAGWLGVVRADALRKVAATQQTAKVIVPAERGAITDRNGIELAVSQPATTIAATPYLVKDPGKVAAKLAHPLRTPEAELLKQLTRRDTGFAYLAHRVPAIRARRVERMNIAGLEFIPEHRRTYPRDFLASQLLGSVGSEGTGLTGLEYSLDRQLRGADGERRLVKDALGEAIELRETRHTRPGSTIRLTIDEAIQDKAEEVLADVGATWHPHAATAIVMDPRSGALLALANWPRVDANKPGNAPDFARQNRAVATTYEPGSTFKPFTVAGALEEREVTPTTKFNLPPTIRLYDREIGESHPRGPVTLSTEEILAQSSNVGAVTIGLKLGAKRFDQWVRRFGFGKPTGTDLPGEEAGIVLPLAKYSGASMGNLPIGQGLAVTPMQMAVAYSAIANGGVLRAAHIVEAVNGRPSPPNQGHRVIQASTAASLRKMLEGVLGPGGTATGAAIKGYELAGKTGTAQKPDPITGGYSATKYVSSFVGFAPAKTPKLLVTVMVDEPKGEIYGGLVAGPAFKRITSFALSYLKIPPE
jgi:cell division protein FtsI/penicillin-binding protein 2